MSVKNLSFSNKFKDISFDLKRGEILGFAGLVGAGRTEVAKAIFGAENFEEGVINLKGKVISNPVGSARGFQFKIKNKIIVSLPGVPYEMKTMMNESIIPQNVNFAIKSQNLENFLKANNIEYETKRSGNVIQNRLVAKSAQDATMMLLCFNTIANLKQMYGEQNVSRIFTLKDSKIK